MSEKCEFSEKEALKMWIFWKMRFWKREFCKKWDFVNVNFVKNDIWKMWILWKMRFGKCEFLEKLRIFAPVCTTRMPICQYGGPICIIVFSIPRFFILCLSIQTEPKKKFSFPYSWFYGYRILFTMHTHGPFETTTLLALNKGPLDWFHPLDLGLMQVDDFGPWQSSQ